MPSPFKEQTASFGATHHAHHTTDLLPPPSPRTHRTLRKLQSAHNLGSKMSHPSLITQQRLQQRTSSPTRRDSSSATSTSASASAAAPPAFHLSKSTNSQRGRANSDAPPAPPPAAQQHLDAMATNKRSMMGLNPKYAHVSLTQLVREGPLAPSDPDDAAEALGAARRKVLSEGIKTENDGMSSLRIYVWLILLDAPVLTTDSYLDLIHRGASPAYSKIRNDTFRTLTTDPLFRRRVSEASLIRLLNAVAWKLHDAREEMRLRDLKELRDAQVHGYAPAGAGNRPGTRDGGSSDAARSSTPTTRSSTSHSRPQSSASGGAQRPGSSSAATPVGINMNFNSSPATRNRARALTLTTEGSSAGTAGGGGGGGCSGPGSVSSSGPLASEPGTYVQGMNVLAAPFLYAARSEAEAFVAFHTLLTRECPGYIRGAMDGVHRGLALVDRVLATVDSRLSGYLLSKGLSAELYAFPSVLTLCACTPPLPEVLRLWDFLFAYGPHLNILCIVAQLMGMRDQLLNSPSPNKLLRAFPSLQADKVIERTLWIIERIPDDIYAAIVTHAL